MSHSLPLCPLLPRHVTLPLPPAALADIIRYVDSMVHKLARCEPGPSAGTLSLCRVSIARTLQDLCRATGLHAGLIKQSALTSAPEEDVMRALSALKYAREELLGLRREHDKAKERSGTLKGEERRAVMRRLHSAAASSGRSGLTGEAMLEAQVLHRFVSPLSSLFYFACAQLTCILSVCPLPTPLVLW